MEAILEKPPKVDSLKPKDHCVVVQPVAGYSFCSNIIVWPDLPKALAKVFPMSEDALYKLIKHSVTRCLPVILGNFSKSDGDRITFLANKIVMQGNLRLDVKISFSVEEGKY